MSPTTDAQAAPDLLDLYTRMLRIRLVEEAIAERYYDEKLMRCPVHLSIGQEAVAVGVCAALESTDLATSTHRSHAHYLAKGGDLKAMLAEIYGKDTGCARGRGGSMHLFDAKAGLSLSVPIVGSSIPLAVGLAMAGKLQRRNLVSVAFLGDGAIEEGAWHESANFAKVHSLPVLFVCENNQFSVYTDLQTRQPDRPLTDLAIAHAIPAHHADGNDVMTVWRRTAAAAAAARRGQGPQLLVFDTYRWLEHCGPSLDNHLGYRAEEEFQHWLSRCPVMAAERQLCSEMRLDTAAVEQLRGELLAEIEAAMTFAREAPLPSPETAGDWLYA